MLYSRPGGGVRDGLAAPSAPERALVLADEYVAAHHAEYINANRQLTPISTAGQRTYAVRYSLSSGESLLLVVDPKTESVTVLGR